MNTTDKGRRAPQSGGRRTATSVTEKRPARRASHGTAASRTARASASRSARTENAAVRRTARPQSQASNAPDVVYLPPKPFNRNRFILRLVTVVAVVIALTLGISVFFKVNAENTVVSGCVKYTPMDILQASGIKDGDNLLTFSRAQAAGKIIASLPYVEQVRIGIKLPDTVKIDVVEVKIPYAVKAQDESWWLISSGGKVIEQAAGGEDAGYTKLLGFSLDSPKAGEQAVAAQTSSVQTDENGNTVPLTVSQAQHLKTALDIAQYLELNGMIGKIASVDVSDLDDILLWYGDRYQVELGDETQLAYKVSCMKYVVEELDDYQSGVLDISFTIWPDKVGYTPFKGDSEDILEIT